MRVRIHFPVLRPNENLWHFLVYQTILIERPILLIDFQLIRIVTIFKFIAIEYVGISLYVTL